MKWNGELRRPGTMLLVLACALWGFSAAGAAVEKRAETNKVPQKTIDLHRLPSWMIPIDEAMQLERLPRGRDNHAAITTGDKSFVPHISAGGLVPGEVKNYPIPPGGIYCGETTYDMQWYGSPQRSIEHGIDPVGGKRFVHVTWTKLETYSDSDPYRNVHYNCYDWSIPGWTVSFDDWGGMPLVEMGERGGFAHVDVNSQGNAVVFHHCAVEGGTPYGRVARFSLPGMAIYTAERLDNPGHENIFLRGVIGTAELSPGLQETTDVYHVGGWDFSSDPDEPAVQCYWRFLASSLVWEGPVPMGQAMAPSHVLASDGDRVIFAWSQGRESEGFADTYNNDLGYWESLHAGEDWITGGGYSQADWDAGMGYNVTDYVDSDPHRVFIDIALLIDFDGRLHALFTTPGYSAVARAISLGPTVMQHWDEGTPGSNEHAVVSGGTPGGFFGGQDAYHSIAAAAMWGCDGTTESCPAIIDHSAGLWNRYISKMTLGVGDGSTMCTDPGNDNTNYGYLYACYTLFGGNNSADWNDQSDSRRQNGNIAISMSNDNGFSWAAPKILTTADGSFDGTGIPTRTPGCDCPTNDPSDPECADPCMSEHWGSMARVVNDTLHVFYVVDYDAGAAPLSGGNWSVNKVVYHPVVGEGTIDGVLCPAVTPCLCPTPLITRDYDCEYHGDLAPGGDPLDIETLTITNNGNADLIFSVEIDPGYCTWLTVDGGCSIPPTTIPRGGDPLPYEVVMNALATPGVGVYHGIIEIYHNDDAVPNPYPVLVDFFVADSFVCGEDFLVTTPCVALEVSNIGSFGRENGDGGMWYYNSADDDSLYSPVYDASLVIANKTATAAGPDTLVYRDIFSNQTPGNPGFRALEQPKLSFHAATNESLVTANMVTVDSAIGISVTYSFPQDPDSCEFVRATYRMYSRASSNPDLIVGAAMDADCYLGWSAGEVGGYVVDYNLLYHQGTARDTLSQHPDTINATTRYAAGMTALTCAAPKRAVVQSNRDYVYPTGGFEGQYLFEELDSSGVTIWWDMEDEDDGMDIVDDLHSLLAFDEVTLSDNPAEKNHTYQLAVVTSVAAQVGVDALDYHAGPYDAYVTDLIATTKKAWRKGFGWDDGFSSATDTVYQTSELYVQATGTHEDGITGGCCGCDFSLVSVVPAEPSITLVDDGDCLGHLAFNDTPESDYEITLSVSDLCGAQTDQITFDVTVETYCYCGIKGDINNDGNTNPLDVVFMVKSTYCSCGYWGYDYVDCWWSNGDVNCSGGSVNPLDVTFLVNYVFKNQDDLCDRCATRP